MNQKIAEKIRKLFALSEGTTFPEEAYSAMQRAQELMAEYGISQADVDATESAQEARETGTDGVNVGGRNERWLWALAHAVASNFRCFAYRFRDRDEDGKLTHTFTFFGYGDYAAIAAETFHFAWMSARSCFREYRKSVARPGFDGRKLRGSYFVGFVDGLREAFAENVTEKALVVVADAVVKQEFAEHSKALGLRSGKPITLTIRSDDAYSTGHRDGRSLKRDAYIAS